MIWQKIQELLTSNNNWITNVWFEISTNWASFLLQTVFLFFAIYLILCNTHGRSVRAIFKIAIVFLLVDLFVRFFHFSGITAMLESLWIFFGLVVIVVFRQEIRHIIDKIGVYGTQVSLSRNTIQAVASAAIDMSAKKTGAIIVLERKIGIDGYIDGSTSTEMLHADMSAKLLKNIFINGSPLHDMAVVIRDNKILAARVLLPLSFHGLDGKTHTLRPAFGTRHAAGLGISERSDAIAIVVSEERGTISGFVDGKCQFLLSNKEAREKLVEKLSLYTSVEMNRHAGKITELYRKFFNIKEETEMENE